MEMANRSLALLYVIMVFLLHFGANPEARAVAIGKNRHWRGPIQAVTAHSWCIASPSSASRVLHSNIDFCCQQDAVDCEAISPGGCCFDPDNAASHASFAMNLYYNAMGKHSWDCFFNGSGLIVTTDPSSGACTYPV